MDSIKNGRTYSVPALTEYLTVVSRQLEKFRIAWKQDEMFDDALVQNIQGFVPYRDELISIFVSVALYQDDQSTRTVIHRFFESLIPYLDRPAGVNTLRDTDFDNFIFIIHELFLYCIGCYLKYERFEAVTALLETDFFVKTADRGRNAMSSFAVFRYNIKSLAFRNERLQLRRLSLRADLLKARCKGIELDFEKVMTADFILFMRSTIVAPENGRWWPETLIFAGEHITIFEVFARSKSAVYFDRTKRILGVKSKAALDSKLASMEANGHSGIPRWECDSFNPRMLLGFESLATQP